MIIKYNISIKTVEDYNLLWYVQDKLTKKRYLFEKSIRPTEFVFKYIFNDHQKRLYIAFKLKPKDECPVCYTELNEYNTIKTNCNHSFCNNCISKLTEYSKNCPCCRTILTSYEEMYVNPYSIIIEYLFIPYTYPYIIRPTHILTNTKRHIFEKRRRYIKSGY
jgi:hypothetical protein